MPATPRPRHHFPRARRPTRAAILLAACLEAYCGTLCGIGRAGIDACPAEGIALEKNLEAIAASLTASQSSEVITVAGENATNEVRNWGLSTARHYRQKAAEVKEILLAMTSAGGICQQEGTSIAPAGSSRSPKTSKTLPALTTSCRFAPSLESSASELKGSIDRMTCEGKAVLDRLQSQVATFEAKLAEAEQLVSIDFAHPCTQPVVDRKPDRAAHRRRGIVLRRFARPGWIQTHQRRARPHSG